MKVEVSGNDRSSSLGSQDPADIATSLPHPRKILLVPFVRSIVPVVDQKQRLLTIDPPSGLLDLAAVPKQPKGKKTRALGNSRSTYSAADEAVDGPGSASVRVKSGEASRSHELEQQMAT